jgi:hypothetical protein
MEQGPKNGREESFFAANPPRHPDAWEGGRALADKLSPFSPPCSSNLFGAAPRPPAAALAVPSVWLRLGAASRQSGALRAGSALDKPDRTARARRTLFTNSNRDRPRSTVETLR